MTRRKKTMRLRTVVAVLLVVVAIAAASTAVGAGFDLPLPRAAALTAFLALLALGLGLWLFGPSESRWSEFGQAIFGSALLALAVWAISELQRAQDERQSLRLTVGLQQELRGVDLSDEDLSGFQLAHKDLSGAKLFDADLSGANLEGATLSGADLTNADLTEANLEFANLQGARLEDTDLDDAEGTAPDFRRASFLGADLSDVSLPDAQLREACLVEANLSGADLTGAGMQRAALTRATLEGTTFETDFRAASLDQAGLAEAITGETTWPRGFDEDPRLEGKAQKVPEVRLPAPSKTAEDQVTEVYDGDTVLFRHLGPVRLIGADAPTLDERLGEEAKSYTSDELLDVTVTYSEGRDPVDDFGRHLLYVWLPDGRMFNQLSIKTGHLIAESTGEPNTRYDSKLRRAEVHAKQKGIGLWNTCPQPELF
jgi:uncharacterized protein YjbI with pentapeptide repeats